MHPATLPHELMPVLPDHTQLPESDGSIVENAQELPQSNLLTDCLLPRLREVHPDGQFFVGCDVGIYWRFTEPVLDGCKAPDWYYVPDVPPMLDGQIRRSYVLWHETVHPRLLIEYVSRDGKEEHDKTPYKGKFWVYEQGICGLYYVIFDGWRDGLEVFQRIKDRYQPMTPNAAGRFPIPELRVELGLWQGSYRGITNSWLRVWDAETGEMILLSEELAELAEGLIDETRSLLSEETERAEAERKRADAAEAALQELTAKLRALGIEVPS